MASDGAAWCPAFPRSSRADSQLVGAEKAAERLSELRVWKLAKVLKCNPDSPQRPVRLRALKEGKVVYMAVDRRKGGCDSISEPRSKNDT